MLPTMAEPQPLSSSSDPASLVGRANHVSEVGSRAALAAWAAPLALAMVVALVVLVTPWPGIAFSGQFPGAILDVNSMSRIVLGLANLSAITAVALSRYRLGLASALAVVPWVLSPLAMTMAWGWWLAALAVLAVAVFDGARGRALWIAALVVALTLFYCTTGVYWSVPLAGRVNLHSRNPSQWLDGVMLSYLSAYLATVGIVASIAAMAGSAARSRRETMPPRQ